MNRLIYIYLVSAFVLCQAALANGELKTTSPDGRLVLATDVRDGRAFYSINYDGVEVLRPSRLGFVANFGDLSQNLSLDSLRLQQPWSTGYDCDKIKRSSVEVSGNASIFWLSNNEGQRFAAEFVVENNSVGFRYLIPKQGETGSVRVMDEATEFSFPDATTTFLCPQSDAMIGWKRTKPSYEEEYDLDAPMNRKSKYGHGFTFPCLFNVGGGKAWALVSETGVTSKFCAAHLSDYSNGAYKIAYPMPEENNGNGTAEPAMALPGETPWRTISVASSPCEVAQQTITWDLVEPQYDMSWKPDYGKGAWSWILWQDGSINIEDQKRFIDLAHDMGFSYALVDNWWDLNIGYSGISELIKYGKSRSVDLVLWYSSSGYWNDIVQGPINKMDRAIVRKAEMRKISSMGVKGIKVDFFGGDKQETMRLYEDILSDAADAGLFVIFHGATMPRGWEKMYPNYVGSEAVLASENLIFEQHHCDIEAMSATLHPFIRNAAGCMEYGGSFLNRRMSKDNRSGNLRLTSNVYSLAAAVAFQNPMQFFALAPNNLADAPRECLDFLRDVPTTWDDTRVIAGYPGKYVVLARKHGDMWYAAVINGSGKEMKIDLSGLPFDVSQTVRLYQDGKTNDDVVVKVIPASKIPAKITVAANGGAVMVGK